MKAKVGLENLERQILIRGCYKYSAHNNLAQMDYIKLTAIDSTIADDLEKFTFTHSCNIDKIAVLGKGIQV